MSLLCWNLSSIWSVCMCSFIQSCPTLCDPTDCNPPGFSVYAIFQARISEWVTISFSRGTSWPRDWTWVSCISCTVGGFFHSSLCSNTVCSHRASLSNQWNIMSLEDSHPSFFYFMSRTYSYLIFSFVYCDLIQLEYEFCENRDLVCPSQSLE